MSLFTLFLIIGFAFCAYYFEKNLNGDDWTIYNKDKSIKVLKKASVPSVVQTVLMKEKIIDDFYLRFNDVNYRWIAKDEWTYTKDFVFEETKQDRKFELIFDGLDTICDVYLNNKLLGRTQNMFLQHIFDVSSFLQTGTNTLTLIFSSSITEAKNRYSAYPYFLPEASGKSQHGEPYRNYIRKEQCSFSWDWGPASLAVGVYKDVKIIGHDSSEPLLTGMSAIVNYDSESETFNVRVLAEFDVFSSVTKEFTVTATIGELEIEKTVSFSVESGEKRKREVEILLEKLGKDGNGEDLRLWWPIGLGEPVLYDVKVKFFGKELKKRIGFRHVSVVQETVLKDSESFYFKINGVKIFSKGANLIPLDSFEDRITEKDYKRVLKNMIDGNMNMIRVWGGGLYLPDMFYDLCDEAGMLVWQEFMFACALYPSNSEFLKSVEEEVIYQVKRLRSHSSIVLYGGNNENEVSMYGTSWYPMYVTSESKPYYMIDYGRLYFDVVRKNVLIYDGSRFFWHSSPSNGVFLSSFDTSDKFFVQGRFTNPGSEKFGDVHYYNYYVKCVDVDKFPKAKFVSEYGFQGLPSIYSLMKVTDYSKHPEDFAFQSDFMNHLQHHDNGNQELLDQMKFFFKDVAISDPFKKFRAQIYLSQLLQHFCIAQETEYYRAMQEKEITMGALYWQANDIWAAPTWSSTEYYGGKWKLLHYGIKRAFAEILITTHEYESNSKIRVALSNNDLAPSPQDFFLTISTFDTISGRQLYKVLKEVKGVHYNTVRFIVDQNRNDFLKSVNCSSNVCQCAMTLSVYSSTNITGTPIASNEWFFCSPKDLKLNVPKIDYSNFQQISKDTFSVSIKSNIFAPFTYFDVDCAGKFDRNNIILFPSESNTITFTCFDDLCTLDKFKSSFFALSLMNTLSN